MKISQSNSLNLKSMAGSMVMCLFALTIWQARCLAQEKIWPQSNIKINPEDVARNGLDKLNTEAHGQYVLSQAPPAAFPVPIPPDVSNSIYTVRGPVVSGSMKVKDSPLSLFKWYKQAVTQRGFSITEHNNTKAEASGRCAVLTATKYDTTTKKTFNLTITAIQPTPDYSLLTITSIGLNNSAPTK